MIRTIIIGTCISVQGLFERQAANGNIIVRVGSQTYEGRARQCLHLGEPCHGAGERDEGLEGGHGLFAAQGDAAETFDAVEEALDEVALLVERPVNGQAPGAGRILLDLCTSAEFLGDKVAQAIGIVTGIGDDVAHPFEPRQQGLGFGAVAPVPRRDREPHRQAEGIDRSVDLGGQPAAGAANRASLKPPLCEVASAWTFEIVASTSTYSKSGSSTKASKRPFQTPARDHRRKRV